MSNLLVIKDTSSLDAVAQIQEEYSLAIATAGNELVAMALTANAVDLMRKAITPAMIQAVKKLENTQLGFMTDRKDGGYDDETIREVMIEALLGKVKLVGNEINIISSRMYVTKGGYEGLMRRDKRFSDLKINLFVPVNEQRRAVVKFSATWKFNGVADSIEGEVPVRLNANSTDDQTLGKAERKVRARIYKQATNSTLSDGEVDGVVDVTRMKRAEATPMPPGEWKEESVQAPSVADMHKTSQPHGVQGEPATGARSSHETKAAFTSAEPEPPVTQSQVTNRERLVARIEQAGIDPLAFENALKKRKCIGATETLDSLGESKAEIALTRFPEIEADLKGEK